jgi:pyridoxal 5'-phosphate synthase pdxT subunit
VVLYNVDVTRNPHVGVLALQGDFEAHGRRLRELGAEVTFVRKPEQLESLDALIIPGGESTTFLNFLEERGFLDRLRDFVRAKPTFGTCAGAILLAKEVSNPPQPSLAALDIDIRRNAYGRQINSFIGSTESALGPIEMVFIRAPRVERTGPQVEVLARHGGDPVLVRQGHIMAATFHPELSEQSTVHAEFLKLVRNGGPKQK